MPVLRQKFATCLHSADNSGIESGVNLLLDFDLTREDLDTIFSLSQMSDFDDPWKQVSTKNKAAFTRSYNKQSYKVSHMSVPGKKKKPGLADFDPMGEGDDRGEQDTGEDEKEDEEDDFVPGLISKKLPKQDSVASGVSKKAKTSSGKGTTGKAASKKGSTSTSKKPTSKK